MQAVTPEPFTLKRSDSKNYNGRPMVSERGKKLINDLKQYIDRYGFTQLEVAERLGINPQQLNDWLQERKEPTTGRALQIIDWLKTKPKPTKSDKRKRPRKRGRKAR
jgi:DNA-binding XRE family transcriptional regulator